MSERVNMPVCHKTENGEPRWTEEVNISLYALIIYNLAIFVKYLLK